VLATDPRGLRGGRSSLGRGGSDVCGRAGLVAQVGRWWAAPLSQEPDGQRLPACSRLVEAGRARGTFSVWCLESAFGARRRSEVAGSRSERRRKKGSN
jgi:hypothetical protein